MICKVRISAILLSYPVFLGLYNVHIVIKFLCDFLLLICFMSIWFLDYPEESKRLEEKCLPRQSEPAKP